MLIQSTRVMLAGLAIAASLAACSSQTQKQEQVITPQNAALAKQIGAKLAEQEREVASRHRAALSKLIRVELSNVRETDRTMSLHASAINYNDRSINALEIGLEVHDAAGKVLGRTELRSGKLIGPKSQASIVFNIPYTQFGEGTGPVREALGARKTYLLDVKEIKYTDGTDAGYDD
jgi:hypothetical protein